MGILTYVKGLPTPVEELNAIGKTQFKMFLTEYAQIFRAAELETVEYLVGGVSFNKSTWNSYLQVTYGINKRQANGIISSAKGRVDSACECRTNHIKTLKAKLKSVEADIKKRERKINSVKKFYAKRNWLHSKTGCLLPLACYLDTHKTNLQALRFGLHQKKRRQYLLTKKIEHLKTAPIRVKVPHGSIFVVGSKDESFGNQVCQWDGKCLTFRVPYCLEHNFGKSITTQLGNFNRKINRLPNDGAKSWHFYLKDGKWVAAVQFTPAPVNQVSRSRNYGVLSIDDNQA